MKVRGWIREGDKAACGATVTQGDPTFSSHGQHVSFDGATMSCAKRCHVVAGANNSTLPSGQCKVLHGDKTSASCPLVSTLNDMHGCAALALAHRFRPNRITLKTARGRAAPTTCPIIFQSNSASTFTQPPNRTH
ncbi:PAAR domain-containing protein [Paraburkholderia sp. GAS199]|uniref:PAAR domain-containing protein n=1 Tax=Paraburkholderia sp. GAS199 TaxID=3035126 RepID=UPI003D25A5CA